MTKHQPITNNQFSNNQNVVLPFCFFIGYPVIEYWVLIGAWLLVIGYYFLNYQVHNGYL